MTELQVFMESMLNWLVMGGILLTKKNAFNYPIFTQLTGVTDVQQLINCNQVGFQVELDAPWW